MSVAMLQRVQSVETLIHLWSVFLRFSSISHTYKSILKVVAHFQFQFVLLS